MSDASSPAKTPTAAKKRAPAPKRRGNRTTRIPEILDCAIRVFATSGDAGFTQRRIAAEAGINLGTLQHYFDSREALLRATIEESSRRYLEQSRALVGNLDHSPEARLSAFIDNTFATFSDPATFVSPFALETWALAERHDWVRELMERNSESYLALFSDLVGHLNPKLTVEQTRIRGAIIYAHWEGLLVFLRRSRFGRAQPLAIKESVKAIWLANAREKP
ncbi:TetR/AcrR family transcriptional regulator [Paraburkholderia acidisoli]|nr:TetR/AcrR family transcriptional regulator [Paraburkholderia acidisoli]